MPTFTTIALENLLEPTVRVSLKKPLDSANGTTEKPHHPEPGSEPEPRHLYISPALYATPEQAPISEFSSLEPLSPSPYVANHKGRRRGNEIRNRVPDLPREDDFGFEEEIEEQREEVTDNFVNSDNLVDIDVDENMGMESDVETKQVETRSFASAQGEFFDAIDDFSSDGYMSSSSFGSRVESEVIALKNSLSDEIERRKTAEETLMLMRCQWERISKLMSQAGFTFPAPPSDNDSMEIESNLMDQLNQELIVSRFVAEAIGSGEGRAEAEGSFASIIEAKDQELSRLRDRMQYYETVNHEMSQRKIVEVARRQQEKKKNRRRWMWSFMGLSVAVGASLVAYSYFPLTSKHLSLLKSGDSPDASNVGSSKAS